VKRVTVAAPPDAVDAGALLVGMKTASIAQAAVMVCVNGLSVEVIEPDASAYTKHKNWKPDEAVALN
jgi:hypothetical protein